MGNRNPMSVIVGKKVDAQRPLDTCWFMLSIRATVTVKQIWNITDGDDITFSNAWRETPIDERWQNHCKVIIHCLVSKPGGEPLGIWHWIALETSPNSVWVFHSLYSNPSKPPLTVSGCSMSFPIAGEGYIVLYCFYRYESI